MLVMVALPRLDVTKNQPVEALPNNSFRRRSHARALFVNARCVLRSMNSSEAIVIHSSSFSMRAGISARRAGHF
jgi:hypothetical protein